MPLEPREPPEPPDEITFYVEHTTTEVQAVSAVDGPTAIAKAESRPGHWQSQSQEWIVRPKYPLSRGRRGDD